ncbi:MAG TPA: FmdB family zinc ribbon protein [Acidimicrobiia bacterium]|jgi:putative FmdB family regulatory protein
MPTYEYRCTKCGEHLEVYQSFSEEPLKKHAGCGGKLNKVLGSVGIVFKGSGFYRTDNRSGSKTASKEPAKESSGSDSSSSSSSDTSSKGDSGSSSGSSDSGSSSSKKSGSDSKSGSGSAAKTA